MAATYLLPPLKIFLITGAKEREIEVKEKETAMQDKT